MSIEKLKLENFTVFKNLDLDFTECINIFIGENVYSKKSSIKAMFSNKTLKWQADVQIFIATHDYILAKYFEVKVKEDNII